MPFAEEQHTSLAHKISRRAFLLGGASAGLGAAALVFVRPGAEAATLNVKDYGAVGDGVQNDAPEIQQALDKAKPGDTVYVPAGNYSLRDALYPRSGTNIEFHADARVIQHSAQHIFVFRNVSNIVTRNLRMRHEGSKKLANPMLWDGASYITNYDTTIERTDAWCGYLKAGSHHITIDGYTVLTADYETSNIDDGIDFVDCHDIVLRKFNIKTNDDAIAFHSWGGGVYNILIENGYAYSRASGGIAFGTALSATIRDCLIRQVMVRDSRQGIYFKNTDASNTGVIRDITFEEIGIFDNVGRTHSGVFIHSVPERAGKIYDLDFRRITYWGPMEFDLVRIQRSKRIRFDGVSCTSFKLPGALYTPSRNRYGVYIEHSQDCRFEGFDTKGLVAQAMLGGSSTTGNSFIGFDRGKMLTENGAQLQDQAFDTAATPTATPSPAGTPRPAATVHAPPGGTW